MLQLDHHKIRHTTSPSACEGLSPLHPEQMLWRQSCFSPNGIGAQISSWKYSGTCLITAASRRRGKMLPDVGMVQMYSKSANVNDLVFVWTGWPPSLHGLALLLLVRTFFPPGGLPCPSETHCTIPTSALVFGGNIFTLYCH